MQKGWGAVWRRLGPVEKAFVASVVLYLLLYAFSTGFLPQALVGFAAFLLGLTALIRLARRALRNAIWRLRNRLIAAYLFIAVVPVVLIIVMVSMTGYVVIGQMAVYLINTELSHRENSLLGAATALARFPAGDPERAVNRFVMMNRNVFPEFDMLVTGSKELRHPADSRLTAPPPAWKRAHGLVVQSKKGEDGTRLYAWAHVPQGDEEVTIVAPITHEVLANLLPGIG